MASRAQLLSDPRSGAKAGAGRGRRAAPDQGSRDELARARARRKPATAGPKRRPAGDDASGGSRRDASPRPRRPARGSALSDEAVAERRRRRAERADDETAELPAADDEDQAGEDQAADESRQPGGDASARAAPKFTTQGAGALLALFAYPLLVNFLTGGPGQMWGWVKAKWVNQPYGASSGASGPNSLQGGRGVIAPAPGASSKSAPLPRHKYGGQ